MLHLLRVPCIQSRHYSVRTHIFLGRMYVTAITKYGIGRWLCRVRLLTTCISEGTLALHVLPSRLGSCPQPLAQSARPHTHTHTHTVRVTASPRIHSFVLSSDFLSAQLCSQSFICTLLAVCLFLSFFRHPHRQSERLLYFCRPSTVRICRTNRTNCYSTQLLPDLPCAMLLWGPFIACDACKADLLSKSEETPT